MIDLKTLRLITRDGLQAFAVGRVLDGIAALRSLLPYCEGETIVHAEAESLEKNYHYMLSFLRKGGNDEKRYDVQAKIQRQGIALMEQASRAIRLILSGDYYSKALKALQDSFGQNAEENVVQAFKSSPLKGETEARQDDLFDLLWTSPLWTAQDTAFWYDFILTQRDMVQQHFMGAVFLSLWEYYDSEKIQLLGLLADSECHRTHITAVAYILLLRLRHRELAPMMPPLPGCLRSKKGRKLVAQVQYEMLLMLVSEKDLEMEVKEAEVITRELLMDKNGLNIDNIKKLISMKGRYIRNRLQRGFDINLSKIPLLHNCDYMRRISHWFLPFDKTHPLFQSVMIDEKGNEKHNLSTLVDLIHDCDVDKLAMLYLVSKDKDFSKAVQHLDDQGLPGLEDAIVPEYTVRFIMQDLFRFFGHSSLHTQLVNPFRIEPTLLDFPDIAALFSGEDAVACCNLLFELEHDEQVLAILDNIMERDGASAPALLLKGKALRRLKRTSQAISSARSAEILEPDNTDILRFLVECYAQQNRFEEELEYLQRMAELLPDDRTIRRLIPVAMTKLGRDEEALQLLFKLDYELEENDEDAGTVFSLIADTALSLAKLDIAERYTEKELGIRNEGSGPALLRMGYIRLLQGDWKGCIDYGEQFINIFCKETGKDIKAALAVLDTQWSGSKWLNDRQSDLLLIHDVLQAQAEKSSAQNIPTQS